MNRNELLKLYPEIVWSQSEGLSCYTGAYKGTPVIHAQQIDVQTNGAAQTFWEVRCPPAGVTVTDRQLKQCLRSIHAAWSGAKDRLDSALTNVYVLPKPTLC